MAIRPFYIEADIDGRQALLTGGPSGKIGTMRTTILQRNKGIAEPVVKITTHSETIDGKQMLTTKVWDAETQKVVFEKTTNY